MVAAAAPGVGFFQLAVAVGAETYDLVDRKQRSRAGDDANQNPSSEAVQPGHSFSRFR
jgi:hypothetical protein